MTLANQVQQSDPVLRLDGVSIKYVDRVLVQDVSFSIGAGKVTCLVGESGSGKSMIANAVMSLLPQGIKVGSGTVELEGTQLQAKDDLALEQIRGQKIGMIFQEPLSALNPLMNVAKQIREVFEVHGKSVSRAEILALLRRVGFKEPERIADSFPHRLSGGQRQRVVIAMAIALKPKLIIADEPTTALDVTSQAQVLDLLKDIRDEVGCAMLFITHDFGVVADISDHVIVLKDGRVVEQGATDAVLKNPTNDYTRSLLGAVSSTIINETDSLTGETAIQAESLKKTYHISKGFLKPRREFHALAGVTLDIKEGETLGIIGESGSGKSTFAKMLVGLTAPDHGRLSIVSQNNEIARTARQRAKSIQMVFQDPYSSLNPRRRIMDILSDGPIAAGMSRASLQETINTTLTLVGLPPDAASRYPHAFSGGQRQRIAIARALIMRPSILVADEPVSALDVSIQRQILDLLKQIKQELALTMVFITHDLRIAAEICDRLAIMREGKVVEYGWTKDVVTQPKDPYTRTLLEAIPGQSAFGSFERQGSIIG